MNNKGRDFEACTLDEVADALCYVHADKRDIWIRMGCAIKNEFGEAGFDVWDQWSAGDEGYNKKQIRADWKAIKTAGNRGTITIASLFHEAIANGYKRRSVNEEDKKRLADEAAQRKVERQKEALAEAEHDNKLAAYAANAARTILGHCKKIGRSPYLGVKKVRGFGVFFPTTAMIHIVQQQPLNWQLLIVKTDRDQFWRSRKNWTEYDHEITSFAALQTDTLIVPMVDETGLVQNLQLIFKAGGKKFLKGGRKSGCWHLIGEVSDSLIVAEGYATAASIHEATGLPVAVAFDAGNLLPVGQALRALYPTALMLFAADDDHETEAAGKGNPGLEKAEMAAAAVGGCVVSPTFVAEAAA